jgi:DNA-binding NtrC family response regulator
MEKILLVGDDVHLLASRAAVLASKKMEVVSCSAREVAAHSEGAKFDLIVLCHSLREDLRSATLKTARQRWPGARMLQILKDPYQMSPVEAGTDAVTSTDPETLIDNVMKLLGGRHNSHEIPQRRPVPNRSKQGGA